MDFRDKSLKKKSNGMMNPKQLGIISRELFIYKRKFPAPLTWAPLDLPFSQKISQKDFLHPLVSIVNIFVSISQIYSIQNIY